MKIRFRSIALNISFAVLAFWLALQPTARAQKVEVDQKGNLFYTDPAGKRLRLTNTGKDSAPCLSPDKRRLVYVRQVSGKSISSGSGDLPPTELRMMDVDGSHDTLLVRSAGAEKPEDTLAEFASPTFSPEGRTIYFCSAAYAVSGAVHAYDVTTRRVRFVMAGNAPRVVPTGEYKGDLLVEQHRYFLGGGSFDWYWLFKPDGKEIGPVGETADNFREMYFPTK